MKLTINFTFKIFLVVLIMSSCSDIENIDKDETGVLRVRIQNQVHNSRNVIESTTFPEKSNVGLSLFDVDDNLYDKNYNNIMYTTSDGSTFDTMNRPTLSSKEAKAVAYYPYSSTVTNLFSIPVTTAEQKDYMYSGSVGGLTETNNIAVLEMKHALSVVRINVSKAETCTMTANMIDLSIASDCFYTSATLNASTGELSGLTGPGAVFKKKDLAQELSTTGYTIDFLVIPGITTGDVDFTAVINGSECNAKVSSVSLHQGYIHEFDLVYSYNELKVSNVNVVDWNTNSSSSFLETFESWDGVDLIEVDEADNGIYAVTRDRKLVADINQLNRKQISQLLSVAIIVNDAKVPQRFMIEKYEETGPDQAYYKANMSYKGQGVNSYIGQYSWGYYGSDYSYTSNCTEAGACLQKPDGSYYSSTNRFTADYSTWTGLLNYYNSTSDLPTTTAGSYDKYPRIHHLINALSSSTDNMGFRDWKLPATAQLGFMYIYLEEINDMLNLIGGKKLFGSYWSCIEYDKNYSWGLDMTNGSFYKSYKYNNYDVRLIVNL